MPAPRCPLLSQDWVSLQAGRRGQGGGFWGGGWVVGWGIGQSYLGRGGHWPAAVVPGAIPCCFPVQLASAGHAEQETCQGGALVPAACRLPDVMLLYSSVLALVLLPFSSSFFKAVVTQGPLQGFPLAPLIMHGDDLITTRLALTACRQDCLTKGGNSKVPYAKLNNVVQRYNQIKHHVQFSV